MPDRPRVGFVGAVFTGWRTGDLPRFDEKGQPVGMVAAVAIKGGWESI
jgi:hypothetical protein